MASYSLFGFPSGKGGQALKWQECRAWDMAFRGMGHGGVLLLFKVKVSVTGAPKQPP